MPIKRCTLPNGGSGYKYGDSGKCYAKRGDAIRQMRAIKYSESHGKKDFIESMANALDPELAFVNAIADKKDLIDEQIDLALDGHGIWNYSCGHKVECKCSHIKTSFYVQCLCPDCLKEE